MVLFWNEYSYCMCVCSLVIFGMDERFVHVVATGSVLCHDEVAIYYDGVDVDKFPSFNLGSMMVWIQLSMFPP